MAPFDLVEPRSGEEAVAALLALPRGEVVPLAGGTDLLLDLDEGRLSPRTVVSLRHLPWRTLQWTGGSLTVGATLTLRSLEADPEVPSRLPALHEAVRSVGSPALRRRATLGGNLGRAAPASDLLPVLLVLDAEIELLGPRGTRTLPVDRFLRSSREPNLDRGELVRSVRFPEARPSAYVWQRIRPANDISQVAVAVAFSPAAGQWRTALGGVPPRSVLVEAASARLPRENPSPEELRHGAEEIARHPSLVSDRRATEEYRRHLVRSLFERAVAMATGGKGGG